MLECLSLANKTGAKHAKQDVIQICSVVTQTVWDTASWSMEDDKTTGGVDWPSLLRREVGRSGVRELKLFLFRH